MKYGNYSNHEYWWLPPGAEIDFINPPPSLNAELEYDSLYHVFVANKSDLLRVDAESLTDPFIFNICPESKSGVNRPVFLEVEYNKLDNLESWHCESVPDAMKVLELAGIRTNVDYKIVSPHYDSDGSNFTRKLGGIPLPGNVRWEFKSK